MKPAKEDLLQQQAAAALKGVPHVKAQQCMYMSLSTLNASPVRVYVETEFSKVPPTPKELVLREQKMAWRISWRKEAQAKAQAAIEAAKPVLEAAGFRVKLVNDYGWAQLTILGKEAA